MRDRDWLDSLWARMPLWPCLLACGSAVPPATAPPPAVPQPVRLVDLPLAGVGPGAPARPVFRQQEAPRSDVGGPGWLGVALTGRAPDQPGAVVSNVLRRSPAALGGL